MKNLKTAVFMLSLALFVGALQGDAFASGWKQEGGVWKYEYADGSLAKNTWLRNNQNWYYFNADGSMKTGWLSDKNNWYYLDPAGGAGIGRMLSGWQKIDSKYYYFNPAKGGAMAVSERTPDGFFVNERGEWVEEKQENQSEASRVEEEVLAIVNSERAKAGISPLMTDKSLSDAASIRAEELTVSFSHTRPDGSDCFSAIKNASFDMWGENIAKGYASSAEVMDGWMHSEGHRKNILNSGFTKIGIGYYVLNGEKHWVQLFGRR